MASTLIYIRHMVCSKCILVVREQLVELGLVPLRVELGEVELRNDAATVDWLKLRQCLEAEGFELLDQLSPQQRLVAQIKEIIAHLMATEPAALRSGHFSRELSEQLQRRFAYLSDVFSATEGLSLEQYVIRQRVEAARCLLREGGKRAKQDYKSGILPFRVWQYFEALRGYAATDLDAFVAAAGTLAHYVGDASQYWADICQINDRSRDEHDSADSEYPEDCGRYPPVSP